MCTDGSTILDRVLKQNKFSRRIHEKVGITCVSFVDTKDKVENMSNVVSDQLLLKALELLPLPLVLEDSHYIVRYANVYARKLGGRDLVGKKCYEVFLDRLSPCVECPVKMLLIDKTADRFEYKTEPSKIDGIWRFKNSAIRIMDKDSKEELVLEVVVGARELDPIEVIDRSLKILDKVNEDRRISAENLVETLRMCTGGAQEKEGANNGGSIRAADSRVS